MVRVPSSPAVNLSLGITGHREGNAAFAANRAEIVVRLEHLFDLIDLNALVNTPVLLAATGGSERHALVLDHQLRPLFSFFQALTLPIGVYATEADFANYQITSEPLKARIRLAAERAAPLFGVHPNNLLKIA